MGHDNKNPTPSTEGFNLKVPKPKPPRPTTPPVNPKKTQ